MAGNEAVVLAELLERCRRDHRAWINGDGSAYALPEGGSVMGAVGGWSAGGPAAAGRQAAVARQWRSGEGDVELLNGAVAGELAWLALLERSSVVLEDEGSERRWDLRVTEVFRRVGDGWERVHRHADPLVDRRSVAEAAALLAER
jgi:ketosteroid isomerase-like protein